MAAVEWRWGAVLAQILEEEETMATKSKRAVIFVRNGWTGKDHLLPELARKVQSRLDEHGPYSSATAAMAAGERLIVRACEENTLYRGCAPGLLVEAR